MSAVKESHPLFDEADHAPITGVRPSRPRAQEEATPFPLLASRITLPPIAEEPVAVPGVDFDFEPAPRKHKVALAVLAGLLTLGAAAVYVGVADRAGLLHLPPLDVHRWQPPPLSADVLPVATDEDDGRELSVSFLQGGALASSTARDARGRRVLAAERELEREAASDDESIGENQVESPPVAPAAHARRVAPANTPASRRSRRDFWDTAPAPLPTPAQEALPEPEPEPAASAPAPSTPAPSDDSDMPREYQDEP